MKIGEDADPDGARGEISVYQVTAAEDRRDDCRENGQGESRPDDPEGSDEVCEADPPA
jgi:hypothetical protein